MSEAAGSEEGVKELPTFLDILNVNQDYEILGLTVHELVPVIMSLIIIVSLTFISIIATRRLKKIPTGFQAFLEIVVDGLHSFVKSQMGKRGTRFLPLVGTLFLYILFMNLMGQVPLFHSPTNNLNTTVALSLIVFFVTQYCGLKECGISGYLKHMMGEPKWMASMMFPLHLMAEFFTKPLSLSMRLFGNIMGEDTVLAIFVGFSPLLFGLIPIPMQFPMVILGVFGSTIQAGIFALLTCFYIGSAMGGQEEEEH
ncbi:MAG: F0F1 ATP synthase subunit A [Candidatus Anammoxibacter sp.]